MQIKLIPILYSHKIVKMELMKEESSNICQNICELERDFKYNLYLLKLRDVELDRCTDKNEKLVHEVRQKSRENKDICERMQALDTELTSLKKENARMKVHYDETVSKMAHNLQSMEISHQEYVREQTVETRRREMELSRTCQDAVRAKEASHQQEMDKMNDRLQREMCLTDQMKIQLEDVIHENISLRNQFQEKQSENISKISILESELKSAKDIIAVQRKELDKSKKDCLGFETELKKTITEKDQVKQELSDSNEKYRNSQQKLNEISKERDRLIERLEEATEDLQTCLKKLNVFQEDNNKLMSTIDSFKQANDSLGALEAENFQLKTDIQNFKQQCCKANHNLDILEQQNSNLNNELETRQKQLIDQTKTYQYIKELEQSLATMEQELHSLKKQKLHVDNNSIPKNVQDIVHHHKTLQQQLLLYKQQLQLPQCSLPDHAKLDTVLKQNAILREVVKAMRRERNEAINVHEIEDKIESLENLVLKLKKSMLENIGTKQGEKCKSVTVTIGK